MRAQAGSAAADGMRRFGFVLLAVIAFLAAGPASARLDPGELARVGAAPSPDARVPLDLALTDASAGQATTLGRQQEGRPALLLPVDYTCGNVCDPMISMTAGPLTDTGLPPGDYAFLVVGLDPRDGPEDARRMLAESLDPAGRVARQALIAGEAALSRLTGALGYRAVYDAETDGFAHPAAAFLLTGDGRLARVLSPLVLNGRDLRLALTEAGEGRTGSLADRLVLLCNGYDAARGVYTPMIRRVLMLAGVATILGIGLLLLLLARVRGRALPL